MKQRMLIITIFTLSVIAVPAMADSFGFYYRGSNAEFGMEFGDYDYYNTRSRGFYEQREVDFYAALDPYGQWMYLPDFDGYVWMPYVNTNWRPYSYGFWTYTHYGWTWVAYEPWGWIPHHYGRWFFHPVHAWIWIPGYTWGPAQVTWSYSNGYWGWAPLPPRHARYYSYYRSNRYNNGYYERSHRRDSHYRDNRHTHWYGKANDYSTSTYRWIPNDAWVFVQERDFLSDNVHTRMAPEDRIPMIMNSMNFKGGTNPPSTDRIEQVIGSRIPVTKVEERTQKSGNHSVKLVRPVNVLEKKENVLKPNYTNFQKVAREKKQQSGNPSSQPIGVEPRNNQTVPRNLEPRNNQTVPRNLEPRRNTGPAPVKEPRSYNQQNRVKPTKPHPVDRSPKHVNQEPSRDPKRPSQVAPSKPKPQDTRQERSVRPKNPEPQKQEPKKQRGKPVRGKQKSQETTEEQPPKNQPLSLE